MLAAKLAIWLLYGKAEFTSGRPPQRGVWPERLWTMLDLVFLVSGCAFFVAAVLYTTACDKL